MINQYKRHDIFRCCQEAHSKFQNVVSVYHVLKEKKCFPQGCIYFRWKCRLLNKGKSCHKKYTHVGRQCFSCKNFFDEKVINKPKLLLPDQEYIRFQQDLYEFEVWLQSVLNKPVDFLGTVDSVKPHFLMSINNSKQNISFKGFFLTFREGFFHVTPFNDLIYLHIPPSWQSRFRFCREDQLEFQAQVTLDKGRIVLKKVRRLEIISKNNEDHWTESQAMVARNAGSLFNYQHEKCLACEKGALLDTFEEKKGRRIGYRKLFCLEGMADPRLCVYSTLKNVIKDKCSNDGTDN